MNWRAFWPEGGAWIVHTPWSVITFASPRHRALFTERNRIGVIVPVNFRGWRITWRWRHKPKT